MKSLLATVLTFVVTTTAWAGTPQVSDQGGFFSPGTLSQANAKVQQIKQAYGRDVVVETFPSIPENQRVRYSDANKDAFYSDWARSRAREQQTNGIMVLITKQPSHLQVEVGNQTQKQAFTLADRDRLRDVLVASFRDRNFDRGLMDALNFVDQTFKSNGATAANAANEGAQTAAYPQRGTTNVPAAPAPAPETKKRGGMSWFWIILLVVGGIFLVRKLMRARASASQYGNYGNQYGSAGNPPPVPGQGGYGYNQPGYGQPGYGGGGMMGGGGGGFGRGILGGLLGGAAGGYLYDKMRGPQGGTHPTDTGAGAAGGGAYGASDTGQGDFSGPGQDLGAGGDFGDAGGSTFDSGGYDSGGGDSGGGDSGGGGDF